MADGGKMHAVHCEQAGEKKTLLREGVSKRCFAAFLFAAMMAIAGLVFINADQTYVMVDILDYPRTLVVEAAGTLVLADEMLSLFLVPLWGVLSDRIARRWIFSSALSVMAIATALHPWATCVFPTDNYKGDAGDHVLAMISRFLTSLLAFRLLFAVGASAATATLTALIGDYSRESGRARIAGITGFSTGIGALIAALLLSRLPALMDPFFQRRNGIASAVAFEQNYVSSVFAKAPKGGAALVIAFTATALLLFAAAIVTAALLTAPPDLARLHNRRLPFWERLSVGVCAMRHPLILLAYASGFVARADSIALHLFIAPWVNSHMIRTGKCSAAVVEDVFAYCAPAKSLASTLMGVAHTAMLVGAPIFGVLCERMGAANAIAIPAFAGAISFSILSMLSEPDGSKWPLIYGAMALAGFADIGMIIASMALISSLSSPQHRGALAGVYSFFGALGIIITSKVGGLFFHRVRESAAFLIVALASSALFLGHLCILFLRINLPHISGIVNSNDDNEKGISNDSKLDDEQKRLEKCMH